MSNLNANTTTLPEFVQKIKTLVEEQRRQGKRISFVRISNTTKDWIWKEGRQNASDDIKEGMSLSNSDSLGRIMDLTIQTDNSLADFEFIVG